MNGGTVWSSASQANEEWSIAVNTTVIHTSQTVSISHRLSTFHHLFLSIDLEVRCGGPVPPLVDLVCDGRAAEWTHLLPVEPESNALVTKNVLLLRENKQAFFIQPCAESKGTMSIPLCGWNIEIKLVCVTT